MRRDASLLAEGREHEVRRAITIGRGPENAVRLASSAVSRRHAVLAYADGRWWIEDRGSANGTFVNGERVPFAAPHPLRHGDRITLGDEELVFSWPAEAGDPDRTDELEEPLTTPEVTLSPFQLQVVRSLCGAWLSGGSLDTLPSNEQIAASLGTPDAGPAVKATLRRIYAKAGLSGLPAHAKRRELCRLARAHNWF